MTTKKPIALRTRPLHEIGKVQLGLNVIRQPREDFIEVPCVQVGDLDAETGRVEPLDSLKPGFVDPQGAVLMARLRAGDILVSCKGTIGKVAMVSSSSEGALPTSNIVVVRPNPEVLPTTLLAVFRSRQIQEHLVSISRGATIKSFSYRELANLPIPIPEMEVQRAIADLLSAHEEAIERTRESMRLRVELVEGLVENALWG